MSEPKRMTVFVTGAAGVVGQALLDAMDDSIEPIGLVYSKPISDPGVQSLKGDVSQPRLGLSPEEYDELVQRVDCVVHSAAITNFSEPPERIRAANVGGTEQALELAAKAGAKFVHVGTALERAPGASEDMLKRSPLARGTKAYRDSKLLANEVVEQSDVPHVTVKPSLVGGHSKTGRIARFQGIHMLLGYVMRGELPVIPFDPETPMDAIPGDVCAEVILYLMRQPCDGGIYYATLGEDARTLKQLVDWAYEFADETGIRRGDKARFVDPDIVDRLLRPVFMDKFPLRARRRIERALEWEAYVNQRGIMESSLPELRERAQIGYLPDLKEASMVALRYWAEHSGLLEQAHA